MALDSETNKPKQNGPLGAIAATMLRPAEREAARAYFDARYECDPNSGCWLWSGAEGAGGYGCATIGGRNLKAHRVSWELHRGPLPSRAIKVCHSCDTPACVNPAHLWTGTQAANVADMMAKGRHRVVPLPGERNPGAKMTEAMVREARRLRKAGRFQHEIASALGVSTMTINRAVRGLSWGHVDG